MNVAGNFVRRSRNMGRLGERREREKEREDQESFPLFIGIIKAKLMSTN